MTGLRMNPGLIGAILVVVGASGWVLGCDSSTVGPGDLCPLGISCDDGDACTLDSCDPDSGCVHAPVDVAIECEDDNPCTLDSCDPAAGCAHDGSGVVVACDDGNPCTSADVCQADAAGSCAGTIVPDSACEDGNPCSADRCDPVAGCLHDGTGIVDACDDASVCTRDDLCQGDAAGTCAGVDTSAACDDGDACTADSCDPATGCANQIAAGLACDDGNPCTAGDLCLPDGSCAGAAPTSCDDSNPCTSDSCDPAVGCIHDGTGISVACDDRNVCTDNDVCRGNLAGTCAGTFRPLSECDDNNVCTVDTCHPQQGCVHDGTGIVRACNDGDGCTAGDVCLGDAAGTCRGPQPVACDDANPCTADSCNPAAGCVHDGTGIVDPCDDESLCTDSDTCQGDAAGTCAGTDLSAQLCGDGNDCTQDVCHPVAGCSNELIPSHACYPQIVVSYPPRAATIQGQLANPQVVVTGQVTSGAGPITSFTLNGVDVPFSADGSFSQPVAAVVGGNALVFEATDALGSWRDRVQAFLWSSDYRKPDIAVPKSGMVDQGMGIWLAQQILDDGDHSLPPNDFATIFEMVLGGIDPNSFFDPNTPIAQQAGYNIYLRSMTFGSTRANLLAINGGMHVTATISNIRGNLFFDCPCGFPCGCWWTGGDSTGGLSMSSLVVDANILLSVRPDHSLLVTVSNPTTSINSLDIWSNDGWTNFLLSIIEVFIRDQLVASLEAELNDQLVNQLAPMLESALGALAISQSFDLPRLDGSGGVITIDLLTDFAFTNFHPGGGALGLRTGAYTAPAVAYDNLGAPQRVGCGSPPQQLVIPEAFPFELVLADDTLNELFYAAWRGGLLEFPIPPEMLGGVDPAQYGIENLTLTVSGMLAPTAADCVNGELKIFIGDLRLDAHFELGGLPVDIIVFATATMGLELTVANGEIAITITQIDGLESELDVVQDELIGLIPLIGDGFELLIADALMQALNGGQLATIPLPEMDLSSAVGLPPGSAVIALDPQDLTRQAGNTIIGGDLR